MPDGILSIGAVFEKAQLEGDFTEASEMVKSATEGWSTAFESSKKATREAAAAMQASVRAFAADVSANAIKAAEGLRGVTAAQTEVRLAAKLMKDSTVDANFGILAMATAQQKLAVASAEAAPAVRALAEEVAASSVPAASAWQRAALSIRESLTSVQEKLVETAETGKLSAEGMTAGFAGLGSLLGAGIAAGFAGQFLDGLAKVNVALDHLHIETGISITDLAGLQEIAKEAGSEWDPIATGLTRMNKNLNDSVPPTKQLMEALAGVNLTIADFKGLTPEEKLGRIARAFAETTNDANRTAAAYAIFGRGGVALISMLVEQGDQLEANMKRFGTLTRVTGESAAAARRWTEDTAKLSAEFRGVMMPVMEHAEDVIMGIVGAWDAAAAVLQTVFEGIATGVVALGRHFAGLGNIIWDGLTGNFGKIAADFKALNDGVVETFKKGAGDIAESWKKVFSDFVGTGMDAINGKLAALSKSDIAAKGAPGTPDGASDQSGSDGSGSGGRSGGRGAFAAMGPPVLASGPQTQSQDMSGIEVAAVQSATAEEIKAYRNAAEEKIRLAGEAYAAVEKSADNEVKLGVMTAQQRAAVLTEAAKRESDIRQAQYALLEMYDGTSVKRFEEDLRPQETAAAQWALKMEQISAEVAQRQQQQYQQMFSAITGPLNSFTDHWLTNGQRMGVAFQKMYDQMAMTAINTLLKIAERWVAHEILLSAAHAAGLATRRTQDGVSYALSDGQMKAELDKWIAMEWLKVTHHAAANAAKTMSDAAAAFAGATAAAAAAGAQVMAQHAAAQSAAGAAAAVAAAAAAPGGIAAAIAAGAATYGAISPYVVLSAFEQGGVVGGFGGGTVPILAHAGERVLSQSQTQNFESMVNQSTSSKSSEVHFHDHSNWNGVDGASVEGMYKKNAAAGRRQMMRQLRLANEI
jgi:hypothetical protein